MVSSVPALGVSQVVNVRPASFKGEPQPLVENEEDLQPAPEKKHHSFLGFLVTTLVTAGIVAGGLALARSHTSLKEIDLTKALANDAKFFDKVKYYTAKAGEFVKEQWGKLVKLFKKDEPKADGEAKPAETPQEEKK